MKIEPGSPALFPAPKQQNAVAASLRQRSSLPAPGIRPGARLDEWDDKPVKKEGDQKANPAAAVSTLPAPQGQPLTRLPLEVFGRILSYLGAESLSAQLSLRTVSCDFKRACRVGLPALDDQIASGYLRRILRSNDVVNIDSLEPFFVQHAPKMRWIDLRGSYQKPQPKKAALLLRLLSERQVNVHTLDFSYCAALRQLPDNFTISGDLGLRNSNISQLPRGLSVGGSLYVSETHITELPQGLSVGGTCTSATPASPSCRQG